MIQNNPATASVTATVIENLNGQLPLKVRYAEFRSFAQQEQIMKEARLHLIKSSMHLSLEKSNESTK